MAEELSARQAGKPSPTLSLDSWAVILALALSLAIWIGLDQTRSMVNRATARFILTSPQCGAQGWRPARTGRS